MEPIIIVDCNALCHKAKHTLSELTSETMHVGVIFGFLLQTLKLAKTEKSSRFAFCWDDKASHRRKLFPAYKEGRRVAKTEKSPEDIEIDNAAYAQFDRLYDEILPKIGFKNNFKFSGYEGDDLIASIVDNSDVGQPVVIVSGDEDMLQCLVDGVEINTGKKRVTKKSFKEEYGISPEYWALVKSIAGCKTDEVPGIKGVGEKTTIKYINDTINKNTKAYMNITCPEGKTIIARNWPLVKLPFKGCPNIDIIPDELDFDAFMDVCNELNFQSILRKDSLQQWKEHIFNKTKVGLF